MKTQDELWAEYETLKEAEDFEAAGKILDLIEPISREEWLDAFAKAPVVEESIPEFIREASRELEAVLARRGRQAG